MTTRDALRTAESAPPLTVRTVEVDDPGDLLGHLPDPAGVAWIRDQEGFVGWGEAVRLDIGDGAGRFERAARAFGLLADRARVTDEVGLPGTGLVAFGSFTFDPSTAGSVLAVPRVLLGRGGGRAWVTVVGDARRPETGTVQALPAPARIRYAGSTLPETAWMEAVASAAGRVRRGELEKVVLARDVLVWSEAALDVRAVAHRLAARFPGCFTFACAGLVGATPELLVRRRGRLVESLVLAGSAARGLSAAEDEALGAGLLVSAKDRAEHEPALASVTDRLGPLLDVLEVDRTPSLLRLANVQHLASWVRGRLGAGSRHAPSALELAGMLHPTAAVCGTPTADALATIRELEAMDRGRYAGPVGWVDARGDGEWGIALRCAEVAGNRARLLAGAGIVGASLPEAELEETRLKLRAMQAALEG